MAAERDDHRGGAEVAVVVNSEGQYSVWPADRPPPTGWMEAGFRGSHADCLQHIAEVWTDMRPVSLREQTRDPLTSAGSRPQPPREAVAGRPTAADQPAPDRGSAGPAAQVKHDPPS